MAPTLRPEFPVHGGATSGQPNILQWDDPPHINDLILLQVVVAGEFAEVTVPIGFVPVNGAFAQDGTDGSTWTRVYWKLAREEEPNDYYVYHTGLFQVSAGMCAVVPDTELYCGVNNFDTRTSNTANTNKTWDAVEPTVAPSVMLCFGAFAGASGHTPAVGMTERYDASGSGCDIYMMTQDLVATGSTGTRVATGPSVTKQRTITLAVVDTAAKPLMPPAILMKIDDGGVNFVGYGWSAGAIAEAEELGPQEGFDQMVAYFIIAPPPDTVRMLCVGSWGATQDVEGVSSEGQNDVGLHQPGGTTEDTNFSFTGPPSNGSTGSAFYVEWVRPVSGDWDVNNESVFLNPLTDQAGAHMSVEAGANAFGEDNRAYARTSASLRVVEIELRDGTIIYPEEMGLTQFYTLAEVEAQPELAVTQFYVLTEFEAVEVEPSMAVTTPSTSGTRAMHRLLPEEITGYAFDPDFSWWSTIVAEKSINMIVNPSFEAWNASDIALEYDEGGSLTSLDFVEFPAVGATAGRRCARLISGAASGWIEYDEGLAVTPGPYTFACDVYVTSVPFTIILAITGTNGVTSYATRHFHVESTGWHRYSITYVETGSGNRECRLTLLNTNPAGVTVYTDAWQFEAKKYATTYFDGDSIGFNDVRPFQSYYWHGAPHASPSTRYETTGSGGRIVSWGDKIGFQTTSIVGLGLAPVEVETQELGDGTEIHRSTNALARTFTITGRVFAKNPRDLNNRQNRLIELFRPNLTLGGEQVILRYQQVDSDEQLVGPPLDIVCAYSAGLEGGMTNFYQAAVALQLHASQPFMREVIDSSAEIVFNKTLVENGIFFRDADGDYVNLGTGTTLGSILGVGFARDGSPIAVGNFTQIAGSAPVGIDNAARWDGSAWVPYGEPAGALQYLHDGRKYGYGPAAVYDAAAVAVYNEPFDQWDVLGNPFLGQVYAIDRDVDGNLWIAGDFETDDPAVTTFNNVARWDYDLEEWQPLGQGLTDPDELNALLEVRTVLVTNDGSVYFGGWFERGTNLDDSVVTQANSAIRWDIATQQYDAMGSGLNAAPNKFIQGEDGYIYAVGEFDQNGTETFDLRGFARYNGYEWEEVFPLQRVGGDYGADGVQMDENGVFWFYNYSNTFPEDYFDIPELGQVGTFGWKNGTFYPPFADVTIRELTIGPGDTVVYNGFGLTGPSVVVPALNTINYSGTADAPLALFLDGPAQPVQVINLSTKGGIYFKHDFEVGLLEHLVARSDTQKFMVYSNARPNLYRYLSAGISRLKALRLRPGINRISVFVQGEGDTTLAWFVWRNRYQALSGPVDD